MLVRNSIPLFFLLLLIASPYVEADGLRCGSRLIAIGDSTFRVESRCGKPAAKEYSSLDETAVIKGQGDELQESRKTVKVEKWTYDFGPGKLLKILTFKDGVLTGIETGGRR